MTFHPANAGLIMASENSRMENNAMTDRAWAFVPDPDGRHRSGISIECAGCSKTAFFAPNSGGAFPPGSATKHFMRSGWTVGKGPRRDFCPTCAAKTSQPKDAKMPTNVTPIKSPSQEPPRVMSRDDRRVIIAEVKGCYDEENKRYMDGWHDERVAQALGAHVPVGWVREVREDYFGEGASNEQFDEFLKKLAATEAETGRIKAAISTLTDGLGSLEKQLAGLKIMGKSVERAIGK